MNKFFNMNSFFTRIILAVLSFTVIICIFIPYMRIPAVKTVQDIDVENKYLDRRIGSDQLTFSIAEFTSTSSPAFELFVDKELTETVNKSSIPLTQNENVYYFATYAYGYDINDEDHKLKSNLLGIYKMVFVKDTKNNSKVQINTSFVKEDGLEGTINVTVPKTTTFDLIKIVDTKNAWTRQNNPTPQPASWEAERDELKNISLGLGEGDTFFAAITLTSEADEMYYPLDVYTVNVMRDPVRETLPVVGEIGGGILSEEVNGKMEFYEKDFFMFTFMILAAVSTIFAFTIPNKFRIAELIVAAILGLGLTVIPVIDIMFYSQHKFQYDPGCFILIALGVIIMLWAVFDFIRCTSDYRKEQIHIYGEDFFSKERRIRMKEERKVKDQEFKIQREADKEALKKQKAEDKAKLAAFKAEQKAKKK